MCQKKVSAKSGLRSHKKTESTNKSFVFFMGHRVEHLRKDASISLGLEVMLSSWRVMIIKLWK